MSSTHRPSSCLVSLLLVVRPVSVVLLVSELNFLTADTNLVIETNELRDQFKGALMNHPTLTSINLTHNDLREDDQWMLLDVVKENRKIVDLTVDALLEPATALAPPEVVDVPKSVNQSQSRVQTPSIFQTSEPETVDNDRSGVPVLRRSLSVELTVSGLQKAIRERCAINLVGNSPKGKKGKKKKK